MFRDNEFGHVDADPTERPQTEPRSAPILQREFEDVHNAKSDHFDGGDIDQTAQARWRTVMNQYEPRAQADIVANEYALYRQCCDTLGQLMRSLDSNTGSGGSRYIAYIRNQRDRLVLWDDEVDVARCQTWFQKRPLSALQPYLSKLLEDLLGALTRETVSDTDKSLEETTDIIDHLVGLEIVICDGAGAQSTEGGQQVTLDDTRAAPPVQRVMTRLHDTSTLQVSGAKSVRTQPETQEIYQGWAPLKPP